MFAGMPNKRCFASGLSGFLDFLPDMGSSYGGKITRKHEVGSERLSTDAGQNKRGQPCLSFKLQGGYASVEDPTNFLQVSRSATTSPARALVHPHRRPHKNYPQESGRQDSVQTVGIHHDEYLLPNALSDSELPAERGAPLPKVVACSRSHPGLKVGVFVAW